MRDKIYFRRDKAFFCPTNKAVTSVVASAHLSSELWPFVTDPMATGKFEGLPFVGFPVKGLPLVGHPVEGLSLVGHPVEGLSFVGHPVEGLLFVGVPFEIGLSFGRTNL